LCFHSFRLRRLRRLRQLKLLLPIQELLKEKLNELPDQHLRHRRQSRHLLQR
jgi:hypothetical protein